MIVKGGGGRRKKYDCVQFAFSPVSSEIKLRYPSILSAGFCYRLQGAKA